MFRLLMIIEILNTFIFFYLRPYAYHCDPSEAVKIHNEVKSMQSIGVHWGTFVIGREVFFYN